MNHLHTPPMSPVQLPGALGWDLPQGAYFPPARLAPHEPPSEVSRFDEQLEEEVLPWETAWIDLGGEG